MQLFQALLFWHLKEFPAFYIIEGTKPCIKQLQAMSFQTDIQRNKLMHLVNTLDMYGVYNAETC